MKHGFTDWVTWGQPYLRINHPCWTFDGHGISNLEFENDPRFKLTGRKEAEFCSVYNIWFSNLRSLKTWDLKYIFKYMSKYHVLYLKNEVNIQCSYFYPNLHLKPTSIILFFRKFKLFKIQILC